MGPIMENENPKIPYSASLHTGYLLSQWHAQIHAASF